MQRIRVTIRANPEDPADDLRYAARVRQDLWAHSPVEINLDNPAHGTHRDEQRNAYFEFGTDFPDEVKRVLEQYGHLDRASVRVLNDTTGPECANCGNIAGPILPPLCPNCGFRDIAVCPSCGQDIPRQKYVHIGGDLFRCPTCETRVRLRFQPHLFNREGYYNEPLILVDIAEE